MTYILLVCLLWWTECCAGVYHRGFHTTALYVGGTNERLLYLHGFLHPVSTAIADMLTVRPTLILSPAAGPAMRK